MKTLRYLLILLPLAFIGNEAVAQQKKVWVSGAARGIMLGDSYSTGAENDTTTARRLEGGHALVDIGVNIQPSDQILIQSMVRVRNDYGGFWGSGVTFDVRQLYIKGIIGGFLKYQLGDINYKLTPYTFQNNTGLINSNPGVISGIPLNQVQYDLFYMDDDTWRQQGAAVDFSLEFSQILDEMKFDLFSTRVQATDFNLQSDRIFSGGAITVKQSKNLNLGVQYANLFDLEGTSNSDTIARNPVLTATAEGTFEAFNTKWTAALETGRSTLEWQGDPNAPVLEDYFYDITLKADWEDKNLSASIGYRDVGPNFRSAGAQSMQINYNRTPQAYERYGNAQELRQIGFLDLYGDGSLYNTQIGLGLMNFDPRYDNATPYGRATPNRKGVSTAINYEDKNERWELEGTADFLSNVVGEGTDALKNYTTGSVFAELRLNKMLGWTKRKLWISNRTGIQNTSRSGSENFEEVDLATFYDNVNLTATIVGDLDLLGEFRMWQTDGFDLQAERDEYSQVINYNQYNIDYTETMLGVGLRYNYSEKTQLSFFWQRFDWDDKLVGGTLPYTIDSWVLFFTMKF